MTRQQVKDAIRSGAPTPGVSQDLFESVWTEVVREQHPTSRVVILQESRSDGSLPIGIHERVARMLIESVNDRPVSHLKEGDPVPNPPRPAAYASDLRSAVAAAVANYKANTPGAPTPKAKPVTLREWRDSLPERVPDPIQRAYILLSGRA